MPEVGKTQDIGRTKTDKEKKREKPWTFSEYEQPKDKTGTHHANYLDCQRLAV
jgi:hypothetical protein